MRFRVVEYLWIDLNDQRKKLKTTILTRNHLNLVNLLNNQERFCLEIQKLKEKKKVETKELMEKTLQNSLEKFGNLGTKLENGRNH